MRLSFIISNSQKLIIESDICANRGNLFCVYCMVITLNNMQIESWHRKQITMELISLLTLIDSDLSKMYFRVESNPTTKKSNIFWWKIQLHICKGQIKSEWIYGINDFPNCQLKNLKDFCSESFKVEYLYHKLHWQDFGFF